MTDTPDAPDTPPSFPDDQGSQSPYGQSPYGQAPYGGHQNPYGQQPAPGFYQAPYVDPYAKSRLVAGLLGIFLGSFGIHRFYLGYTQIGVWQIVATILTCGVAGIWGFVEGILYLASKTGSYSVDATGRPLTN